MRRRAFNALLMALFATPLRSFADEVILSPEDFVSETFGADTPSSNLRWLDDQAQVALTAVFGHRYPQARLRYWRHDGRTAWILDEIGKEYPITAGFVVRNQLIEQARVLIYRESRGDQIRFPVFLKQFAGAQLENEGLSRKIDGISGATLSVRAMERMARAALTLDRIT
jgi:hypothetical protein